MFWNELICINSRIEVGDDEEPIAARDKAKEAVEGRVEVAERNGS